MKDYKLVTVTEANLAQHPQVICFINPKHPSYHIKRDWLVKRFREGLVIKLLYPEGETKAQGYIEYVPGENAWRAVSAQGYLFIHCVWVYSTAYKNKGIGSLMVQDCIKQAGEMNLNGVAVLAGGSAFLAKSGLFKKNGFITAASDKSGYELMVYKLKQAPLPSFNSWQEELKKYNGLNIVYTNQCPWVAKFISELDDFFQGKGVSANVIELKTPQEAQHALSPYATFNLIHNGKLLADHYISFTRFNNILKKEKLI
jgi:GNAT superfamily N-acetyltransferase